MNSKLKKYTFSNWSFFGMILFAVLHLFGAHLTYEKTTYFIWFSDFFGWERNYYDQFIHFLFGLLVFIPFFEIFYHQRYSRKCCCSRTSCKNCEKNMKILSKRARLSLNPWLPILHIILMFKHLKQSPKFLGTVTTYRPKTIL